MASSDTTTTTTAASALPAVAASTNNRERDAHAKARKEFVRVFHPRAVRCDCLLELRCWVEISLNRGKKKNYS
jgi:hypothetical protein